MMFMFYLISMILALPFILLLLTLMLNKSSLHNREKLSPFECGFDPPTKARMPFSLRFFFIGILFIIFDVEIALIIPLPIMMISSPNFMFLVMMFAFLAVLLLGLMYEWMENTLYWPK